VYTSKQYIYIQGYRSSSDIYTHYSGKICGPCEDHFIMKFGHIGLCYFRVAVYYRK